MHTFYFETLGKAKEFSDWLCIYLKDGGACSVMPTSPFDGWYRVMLHRPTSERQAVALRCWNDENGK